MRLLASIQPILSLLAKREDIQTCYVSRTSYPKMAAKCLKLIDVDADNNLDAIGKSSLNQIYPGDKKTHFRKIQKKSGVKFENMLFFDNEYRNVKSVEELGITSVPTPDGVTKKLWHEGLSHFS